MTAMTTRLSDFLPYLLSITSNAVSDRIAEEYHARFGLKIAEWRVMAVLGDAGALTQRELVGATLMDKVAVNRACKMLGERGLVARTANEADGRSHHLWLTDAGRAMYDRIWPNAFSTYEKIFAALSPAETAKLRALLDKLLTAVRTIEGESA